MLKFSEKVKLETHNAVIMVTGLKQSGREVFVEMEMTKEQVEKLDHDSKAGKEIIITEYGKVLNYGWAGNN